jgi:hypothetical protein
LAVVGKYKNIIKRGERLRFFCMVSFKNNSLFCKQPCQYLLGFKMKKIILGSIVLSLIFAASCTKKTTYAGGSWTFEGDTFYVANCAGIGNTLVASSSANSNINTFGNLGIVFPGSSLPRTSGTYTVVDTTPLAMQVNITATTGGVNDTLYTATGGNGSNQTIAVTVSNGIVSVSGTGIEIYTNNAGVIDSSALSFNIHTAGKN